MQRVANSIEEEMIVKAIREESPWEKLPKRLKLFLSSNEEYEKRVKDYCIKKRFKWRDCAARNACKENEYYEDLMRYLRKNLALFPYHLSENVCRILRISPFQYYCEMLYEVMKNERPYDSIPNFSAADALRLTGIGRNEFIDIMNKCRAKYTELRFNLLITAYGVQKLMWKLNKSIARDLLPKAPVDFLIEPWWTVSIVNLTVEEFRKISDDEMIVVDKVGKEELNLVAELDLEIVRGLYRGGLMYLEVPVYPDDHFQVSTLDGFVSNRDQSYEDPTEELLYAVFVASSEQATISELAQTLQADLSQLEAAVSLASRLGWAKKVLDPASLLNDSLIPGSPRSEDGAADEGFKSLSSMPPSPLQEGMPEADGDVIKSQAGITRFALMVDANLTSYLMMGSLSPGLKGHAVTLYEAGKLGDSNVAEMCEDLRQVEGTKFEGELQQLANHAFSFRLALECLRSGGTGLAGLDAVDAELDLESPEKSGTELGDFQLGPSAVGLSSIPQLGSLPTFNPVDQDYSSPELQGKSREPEDDLLNFEMYSSKATDELERPIPLDISPESRLSTSSSTATDVFGRPKSRNKKLGRKYRVDVLRVESLQGLSPGTIHRVLRRDYDVVVSMIPLLSPPSVVSADGSGPVHFGPPSRAAITPWMKLLLYSVSGSGPVSVALIKGQRLRLLPPPLAGCAKALVWAWDGVGVSGIGGKFDGSLVEGRILLHCLNSLLKYSAVLVQPFPMSSLGENGSLLTKNAPLPLSDLNALNIPYGNDQALDASYMYQPSTSLLAVADELNLDTVGYIHMIRLCNVTGAVSSPNETEWEWIPQSVEFGLPLFDTKLCKLVCDGAVRSELFQSSTLSKHREAMQKLRRKLREFIADHQANGPISRLAYPGGPLKSGNKPALMSFASSKWNPSDGMFDPLHSPSSSLLSPSDADHLPQLPTDGKFPTSSSLPLPPILHVAEQGPGEVPANSDSAAQKMDYVEDDDGSDVPLPGVNLIFDGLLLRPLNISIFLQGRLPVALVAEAAAASDMLRVAA